MQIQQHNCSYEDCPLKNWPTKEKDLDMAFEVLFDIVRSSMSKYSDYDRDKKTSSALISEWVDKMINVMSEHYDSVEMQRQNFYNTILTLAKTYQQDGLPREALNEFIANEKNRLLERQEP